MKKIRAAVLIACLAPLSFSCASLAVVNDKEVAKVVALINAGDVEKLEKLTALPFLLDGEIIALPGDAGALWRNLKAASFTLRGAKVTGLIPARKDAYKLFADTWEVSVFFRKYVPPNSMIAEVSSGSGKFLLLLGGYPLDGYARVIGVKLGGGEAP